VSDRNAEIIRASIEAWNAGNQEDLLGYLAPDAEIRTLRSELEGRPYRGPEGFRRAISDFEEDWEYVRFRLEEIEPSNDVVFVRCVLETRGRGSGIELEMPIGWLWEFRDGLVIKLRTYSDPDEARRAAGLSD
jgi:ketosteroid isomerase-like protein